MGGQGPGHKSVRAIEARLKNIQKARAARRRAPLPWRSGLESRIIEQLVWQWWMDKNSGQWLVTSGEKSRQQVPHRHPAKATGWVRDDRLSMAYGRQAAGKPWAKYRVARFLGVSHTWVNKLVKRFEADPDRMRRKMAAFAPANFEKLERAREETRRQQERGWLREPIRYRRVKVMLYGKKRKVMAPTRGNKQQIRHTSPPVHVPLARQAGRPVRNDSSVQRDSASRAGAASSAPTKASAMPVRYAELPPWASGLPLPGGTGIAAGRGPARPGEQATAGKPRAVPFAYRRRR